MNAVLTRSHYAKTSNDILRERNELDERVRVLEALVSAIAAETRHALGHPEIALTTLCRIETLVRRESIEERVEVEPVPQSGLRPLRSA